MTVRAILDSKGHQILSVEPDAKLSAAVKLLGERKIGAVLVMSEGRLEGILSERDIVRVLGERGAKVLDEPVSVSMTRKVVSCRQSDHTTRPVAGEIVSCLRAATPPLPIETAGPPSSGTRISSVVSPAMVMTATSTASPSGASASTSSRVRSLL